MPEQSSEHLSADRGMRWLRNNWYVPIVVAIDMAIIWRPHAVHHQTAPDNPAVADSSTGEILQEELADRPREEPANPHGVVGGGQKLSHYRGQCEAPASLPSEVFAWSALSLTCPWGSH